MYKKITAKNGRTLYFKDNKLTKKENIPQLELEKLELPPMFPEAKEKPVFDATAGLDVEVRDLEGGTRRSALTPQTVDAPPPEEPKIKLEPIPRECIFCGGPPEKEKFIALKTVYLCDEHYFGKTSGKIVQQLRERKML